MKPHFSEPTADNNIGLPAQTAKYDTWLHRVHYQGHIHIPKYIKLIKAKESRNKIQSGSYHDLGLYILSVTEVEIRIVNMSCIKVREQCNELSYSMRSHYRNTGYNEKCKPIISRL